AVIKVKVTIRISAKPNFFPFLKGNNKKINRIAHKTWKLLCCQDCKDPYPAVYTCKIEKTIASKAIINTKTLERFHFSFLSFQRFSTYAGFSLIVVSIFLVFIVSSTISSSPPAFWVSIMCYLVNPEFGSVNYWLLS